MDIEIPTLYEDDALLAVDKPEGLATIPGRIEKPEDSVRGMLEVRRGARLWVVHRLDRGTSGLLLFAKSADAHRALCLAFERRDVKKRYVALVQGAPPADAGFVDAPLRPGRKGRMRVAAPGEPGALASRTAYVVRERFVDAAGAPTATLVDFAPETGRQHQLRVHAASLGCPVLGDPLYAFGPAREAAPRLMLHASEIMLPARDGRPPLALSAPPPRSFLDATSRLRAK